MLADAAAGSGTAAAELLPIVYDELRALAESCFRDQKPGHTLQATALVHEAYLKLVDESGDIAPPEARTPEGKNPEGRNRRQFFALAAQAMRSILVDHARGKLRQKRGGGNQRISLEEADQTPVELDDVTVLAIDTAMTKLAQLDARKAKLVELRFFGGLTADEAAEVLGIARSTAAEEWRMARAWLHRELRDGES